jgi:hypothetical protein
MGGWFITTSLGGKIAGMMTGFWDHFDSKALFFGISAVAALVAGLLLFPLTKKLNEVVVKATATEIAISLRREVCGFKLQCVNVQTDIFFLFHNLFCAFKNNSNFFITLIILFSVSTSASPVSVHFLIHNLLPIKEIL